MMEEGGLMQGMVGRLCRLERQLAGRSCVGNLEGIAGGDVLAYTRQFRPGNTYKFIIQNTHGNILRRI